MHIETNQTSKPRDTRKQRGITLIESLLVLAVGAFVIAGAVMLYNTITAGNDVNQTISQVQAITSNVQRAYNVSGSPYNSLTTQSGINIGAFPSGMVRGSIVYNTWNGTVTLSGTTTTFTISYAGIPQGVCANLASSAGSLGDSLTQISVNGTGITPPVDPAAAGSACSQASNTIVWTLR